MHHCNRQNNMHWHSERVFVKSMSGDRMEFGDDDDLFADVLALLNDDSDTVAPSTVTHEDDATALWLPDQEIGDGPTSFVDYGSSSHLGNEAARHELAPASIPAAMHASHVCGDTLSVTPLEIPPSGSSGAKTTRKHDPNRARSQRTQEVKALRNETAELSRQLAVLQRMHYRGRDALLLDGPTKKSSLLATSVGEVRIWEEICRHQLERRMQAERENARLKQVVNDQMNVANSLQRMLRRPAKQLVCMRQNRSDGIMINSSTKRGCDYRTPKFSTRQLPSVSIHSPRTRQSMRQSLSVYWQMWKRAIARLTRSSP